jgi:hypothetical protein
VVRHKHAQQCSQKTTIPLFIKHFNAIHKRKVGEADSQMATPTLPPPAPPPSTVRRERGHVSMSRRMTTGLTTGSCYHCSSRLHAPPFSSDCHVFSGKVAESYLLPLPSSRLHPPSPLFHPHYSPFRPYSSLLISPSLTRPRNYLFLFTPSYFILPPTSSHLPPPSSLKPPY